MKSISIFGIYNNQNINDLKSYTHTRNNNNNIGYSDPSSLDPHDITIWVVLPFSYDCYSVIYANSYLGSTSSVVAKIICPIVLAPVLLFTFPFVEGYWSKAIPIISFYLKYFQ